MNNEPKIFKNSKEFMQWFNDEKQVDFETRRSRTKMKDGFSVSIQASEWHYCTPRKNNCDFYETFELGFPSKDEILIKKYAEDKNYLTDTIYPEVPIDVVLKLIKKHGGVLC